MSKVINIFTKKEIIELPFDRQAAQNVMGYLLNYKASDFMNLTMSERLIIDHILNYVANASGADSNEMLIHALTEIDPSFGEAL